MQRAAQQALEFYRIVDAVRSFSATPLGRDRLASLRPQSDPRRAAQWLSATSEGVRYLADGGLFPLQAPADIDSTLGALAIEGRPLEPIRLLGLADFLDSLEQTRTAIRKAAGNYVYLGTLIEMGASFKSEIGEIREKIDPSGEVADHASGELRSIRDRLRKQRTRLRTTLESYLRGRDTSRYLQDQIVTDRNGRYVLVVRAEHRTAIPGIIHGSSSSGASLYLEPLSTVEVNNEIVALEEQEAAEVRRILLALTDAFRRRAVDVQRTLECATELDVVQAKARFSLLVGGVEPTISTDGALELQSARHPLLIRAVTERLDERDMRPAGSDADEGRDVRESREQPAEPVPVDILLTPPSMVLVITGPNTGGKTVALKTAGLLALMAQAGLHIPAAPGSRLPVFRSIFADIGDEQSIAANLSTFSWHVTNIASMDRLLALPALVLFDELGSGTDPAEGGALATAVVDYFRTRGALVLCTSHSEAVKTYATTTAGVTVAAFGFDPATFAPSYRLVYGSPGRSLALEIAGRLGLNADVIAKARQNMGERDAQLAEHLAKIDQNLHELEHERRLVARERQVLTDAETRVKSREDTLRQREEAFHRKTEERLDDRLRDARREIDKVIDDLKKKTTELTAEAERRVYKHASTGPVISTGAAGAARVEARQALEDTAARLRGEAAERPAAQAGQPSLGKPSIGDRVAVAGLGLEGVLASLHGDEAEIDMSGKRLRARMADVRLVARAATASASQPASRVSVQVQLQPRGDSRASDLNVIGCTVEEALTRTERFLDETLLADQRTVRVIHGYGTGQLRRAIAEYLRTHPLVANYQQAPPEQGGGGVTVVDLKD
ncbi:MAG TPA: Smr/MutS family protein [Vicinamibacterales bacterium]|jgi:DNA mismatch repair protein MutS2